MRSGSRVGTLLAPVAMTSEDAHVQIGLDHVSQAFAERPLLGRGVVLPLSDVVAKQLNAGRIPLRGFAGEPGVHLLDPRLPHHHVP
jgi:hypothetical protein